MQTYSACPLTGNVFRPTGILITFPLVTMNYAGSPIYVPTAQQ